MGCYSSKTNFKNEDSSISNKQDIILPYYKETVIRLIYNDFENPERNQNTILHFIKTKNKIRLV